MNIVPSFIRRRLEQRPTVVRILDNIGWLAVDKALRLGLALVVSVWLARYLGPEQFGVLSYALAFTALFGVLAGCGIKDVVVREIVREPASTAIILGSATALLIVSGATAYVVTIIGIHTVRPDDTTMQVVVAILGFVMLFRATDVAVFWFEAEVRSKYIVWAKGIVFFLAATVKVALILNSAPLLAFVWVLLAEALAVCIAVLVPFSRVGPGISALRFNLQRTMTILRDSWPLAFSAAAIMVYMKIDQLMIGELLDDAAVGVYSAAVTISEVWYFVPVIISASMFPSLVSAVDLPTDRSSYNFQRLFDLVVLLALGIAVPMTFLSDALILSLFGRSYETAGQVLAIHIWASIFVFLGVASERWLVNENQPLISMQRTLLGASINIALNLLMIPAHGILGAAFATVVSQSVAAYFQDALRQETRRLFMMKTRALNPFGAVARLRAAL